MTVDGPFRWRGCRHGNGERIHFRQAIYTRGRASTPRDHRSRSPSCRCLINRCENIPFQRYHPCSVRTLFCSANFKITAYLLPGAPDACHLQSRFFHPPPLPNGERHQEGISESVGTNKVSRATNPLQVLWQASEGRKLHRQWKRDEWPKVKNGA